jgi:diguanylate cyclase (GGDEF)-like protein
MAIAENPVDIPASPGEETEVERLEALVADNALTLDLVSALAGDRQLTEAEKTHIDDFRKSRGDRFFADILFAITHQYFPPTVAENLWNQLLKHKYEMSFIMKRNIRIAVAALDYLSNLTGELQSPTLIDETQMTAIVQLTLRDGLTRLFNHTTCFQRIEMELSRFERYETVVSIMMIDIDDFKEVNDRYGHIEGDRILTVLAGVLKTETRDTDICCRYGGEEFVVIMPSTDLREAGILAERLRSKVEKGMHGGRGVTISIGVASCDTTTHTSKSLVEKADVALYRAKQKGKNRVEVSVQEV